MPPPPLPSFWELHASHEWEAIDFISDIHLSEQSPRTFDAWAAYLRDTDASAVFILGDLFELWIGDDARHDPFESACADALAEGAARRTIAFMPGNRDFLMGGAMLRACGLVALPDPTVLVAFGERLLLAHGDALCLDDVEYQRFRTRVRSLEWQRDFLAQPLADRRAQGRRMREQSEAYKSKLTPSALVDIDRSTAVRWLHEANAQTLIHGHTHRPAHESLAPGYVREVLSDWDLDHTSPRRAEVLRLRRSGLRRFSPLG
jgi:UDP-2,3-diacylglucosamine hydrolase